MSVLDQPLVLVDIETNGLNHMKGRVIEVAAIRVENGAIVKEFRQLIDPGTQLPQFITSLTGITQQDLVDAPVFMAVADELHEVLQDAIFVAHNVRFDYSFLKQEFKRIGKEFRPQQLCTVKLSRALFPEHRGHKLQDLITRHSLQVAERHRAYDDAHALWQFLQHIRTVMDPTVLEQALTKQLRKPSLPKGLTPDAVSTLPDGSGVYIFEDEKGSPIYIGKSVNIRKRVASHFMRDHDNVGEFKIAQHVKGISTRQTEGELQALLLESRLVKEMQPLYNKQLRKTEKLLLATQVLNDEGYATVVLDEAANVTPDDVADTLAIYTRRGQAKDSLEHLARDWELCPKLLGLERGRGTCFWYQLRRCKGACAGKENAEAYNVRVRTAFGNARIEKWPYASPILVQEKGYDTPKYGIVVDQWCVVAEITQEEHCSPTILQYPRTFDLDTYKILQSYIKNKTRDLIIRPISLAELQQQIEST